MAKNQQDKKEKKAQFLPWQAINSFMMQDFQHEVMMEVLGNYGDLTSEQRKSLNLMIKKGAKVNGFRNAAMAPLGIKVSASIELFEQNGRFAATVLASWWTLKPDLSHKVYELLTSRGWEVLPEDADRTKLPGFITQWPKRDEFDVLVAAFREANPEDEYSDNQISLMAVWISGRLPFELVDLLGETEEVAEETETEPEAE